MIAEVQINLDIALEAKVKTLNCFSDLLYKLTSLQISPNLEDRLFVEQIEEIARREIRKTESVKSRLRSLIERYELLLAQLKELPTFDTSPETIEKWAAIPVLMAKDLGKTWDWHKELFHVLRDLDDIQVDTLFNPKSNKSHLDDRLFREDIVTLKM